MVGNRDADDPGSTKVARIRDEVSALDLRQPFADLVRDLTDVLGSHTDPEKPLENTCVHTPDYGTRSASILVSEGPERGFWYADGPPCETKFRNVSSLLDTLR